MAKHLGRLGQFKVAATGSAVALVGQVVSISVEENADTTE